MRNLGKALSIIIIASLLTFGVMNFINNYTTSPEQIQENKPSHVMIVMGIIHKEEQGYFSPGRKYVRVNAYSFKNEITIIEKPYCYDDNSFTLDERNKIMQVYDSLYKENYRIAGTSVSGELIFELK